MSAQLNGPNIHWITYLAPRQQLTPAVQWETGSITGSTWNSNYTMGNVTVIGKFYHSVYPVPLAYISLYGAPSLESDTLIGETSSNGLIWTNTEYFRIQLGDASFPVQSNVTTRSVNATVAWIIIFNRAANVTYKSGTNIVTNIPLTPDMFFANTILSKGYANNIIITQNDNTRTNFTLTIDIPASRFPLIPVQMIWPQTSRSFMLGDDEGITQPIYAGTSTFLPKIIAIPAIQPNFTILTPWSSDNGSGRNVDYYYIADPTTQIQLTITWNVPVTQTFNSLTSVECSNCQIISVTSSASGPVNATQFLYTIRSTIPTGIFSLSLNFERFE